MVCHALLMTFFSLFLLNAPGYFNDDAEKIVAIRALTEANRVRAATAYLDSNFVLIDNAFDKESIVSGALGTQGNSTVPVTKRKDLVTLLTGLSKDSSLDLVVFDMDFADRDKENDKMLVKALLQYSGNSKLLMAVDSDKYQMLDLFPDSILGRITDEATEGKFTFHQIIRGSRKSLPYLLHERLDNAKLSWPQGSLFLETGRQRLENQLRMNRFFPEMLFKGETEPVAATDSGFSTSAFKRSWQLEFFRDSGNVSYLRDDLLQRKKAGLKNILLIGSFSGVDDLHRTTVGQLQGPVILYNTFYGLHMRNNIISGPLFLMLLLMFFLVTFLVIWDALLVHRPKTAINFLPKLIRKPANFLTKLEEHAKSLSFWKRLGIFLVTLVIENAYLIFFMVSVLLIKYITGTFINGIWLIAYIVFFKKAFAFFAILPGTQHEPNHEAGT